MEDKKEELNKSNKANESLVAKKFASKDTPKTDTNNLFSKLKGKGEKAKSDWQDARNSFKQLSGPNSKKWDEVLAENENDPEKTANWLNNNPDYKAGDLTKKGMSDFGYKVGEDGKWSKDEPKVETTPTTDTTTTTETASSTNVTTDEAQSRLKTLTEENENLKNQLKAFQNKDGSFNEQKTYDAMASAEQKLAQMGAGSFDEGGKFVLKDTTKSGWEDYATMLSAGLSVLGLAMGVPILPINFKKITNKDEKDAAVREFQKQYTDMFVNGAAKVEDVKSSEEAGKFINDNQKNIDAFTKYKKDTAAAKDVIDAQTDAEKELIETRTEAQIKADQAKFDNDMKRLNTDNNFKLNYAYLQNKYGQEFAKLQDALTTNSAKELLKYQNTDMLKEIQQMVDEKQIDFGDIASYYASKNSISPSDKNWNRVGMGVDFLTKISNEARGWIMPGSNKDKK